MKYLLLFLLTAAWGQYGFQEPEYYDHICVYGTCDICGKDIYEYAKTKREFQWHWNNTNPLGRGIIIDSMLGPYVLPHGDSYADCHCKDKGIRCEYGGKQLFVCQHCYEKYIKKELEIEKQKEDERRAKQLDKILKQNEANRHRSDQERKRKEIEATKNKIKSLEKELRNMKKWGVPYDKDSSEAYLKQFNDTLFINAITKFVRCDTLHMDTATAWSSKVIWSDTLLIDNDSLVVKFKDGTTAIIKP